MYGELSSAIQGLIKKHLSGCHTAVPGRVVKYYPEKGMCDVQPIMQYKKPNGEWINYPELKEVPVWWAQSFGQDVSFVYPIKKGDEVLVLLMERPIDYWLFGMQTNQDLMFDLSEAICIPGLFARPNPLMIEAQEEEAIIIQRKDTLVKIKEKEIILDCQETVTINSEKDIILNAEEKIELNADEIKMAGTSVSVDADMSVDGDVEASEDVVAGDVSLTQLAEDVGSMEGPDSYSEEANSGGGITITIGE